MEWKLSLNLFRKNLFAINLTETSFFKGTEHSFFDFLPSFSFLPSFFAGLCIDRIILWGKYSSASLLYGIDRFKFEIESTYIFFLEYHWFSSKKVRSNSLACRKAQKLLFRVSFLMFLFINCHRVLKICGVRSILLDGIQTRPRIFSLSALLWILWRL